MRYVRYKGSIYSKANERIREFVAKMTAENTPFSITAEYEIIPLDNFSFFKVKATVTATHKSGERMEVTGYAMRRYEKDHPFGSYPLEWAETIATARAIGKLGIGIDYAYACLEELGDLDSSQIESMKNSKPSVELVAEPVEIDLTGNPDREGSMNVHSFTVDDMLKEVGMDKGNMTLPETPVEEKVVMKRKKGKKVLTKVPMATGSDQGKGTDKTAPMPPPETIPPPVDDVMELS